MVIEVYDFSTVPTVTGGLAKVVMNYYKLVELAESFGIFFFFFFLVC